MAALYYEDLVPGRVFRSAPRVITEADLLQFAQVSGDRHPIHTDAAYAAQTPFGQRILHGPFGIAMAIGLFGEVGDFRDTAMALLDIREWQFRAPMFIGDAILLEMTIAARHRTRDGKRGIVDRLMKLIRADGTVVQEGHAGLMIACRGPAESGEGRADGRGDGEGHKDREASKA